MNVNANKVIDHLKDQLADAFFQNALLQAQVDTLLEQAHEHPADPAEEPKATNAEQLELLGEGADNG